MISFDVARDGLMAAAPSTPAPIAKAMRKAMPLEMLRSTTSAGLSLGNLAHESLEFTRLEESFRYRPSRLGVVFGERVRGREQELCAAGPEAIANVVYGGRMCNDKPGDGWRYRGRGIIHLTGRYNYRDASKALGVDYEGKPHLAAIPSHAWRIADWYLAKTKRRGKSLIQLAHEGRAEDVTRGINGGMNGHEDRIRRSQLALAAMGAAAEFIEKPRDDVMRVQMWLRDAGYPCGPIDGKPGPITTQAIRWFQQDHGLVADGIVGRKTKAALKRARAQVA